MIKQILFVSAFLIILASCTKEEEKPNEYAPTATDLLTSGEWILTGYIMNGKDIMEIFPDCSRDDITAYLNDGTAYIDVGEEPCDTSYPARVTWSWELIDDDTRIKETVRDSNVYIREIITLNDSELVHSSINGNYSYIQYYKKK